MLNWQRDVVEEHKELEIKLAELNEFLHRDDLNTVEGLSNYGRVLMASQRRHMKLYLWTLKERIAQWENNNETS